MINLSDASGDVRDSEGTEKVEGLGMATNIRINEGNKLFLGKNQYDQFMKCFHKVRLFFILQNVHFLALTIS